MTRAPMTRAPMTRPRLAALVALVAVAVAGAIVGLALYTRMPGLGPADRADPGGRFDLIDTAGRPVTDRDLVGKPTAIFFGFTFCPEVCPTELAELTTVLKAMGPDAGRLNVVFVSVDPERDTPAQLRLYLSNFDPHIRGLTGTPAQVQRIARAYKVYYQKVPTEGGYTVDHSTSLYLMDRHGRFVDRVAYGAEPQALEKALRTLLAR